MRTYITLTMLIQFLLFSHPCYSVEPEKFVIDRLTNGSRAKWEIDKNLTSSSLGKQDEKCNESIDFMKTPLKLIEVLCESGKETASTWQWDVHIDIKQATNIIRYNNTNYKLIFGEDGKTRDFLISLTDIRDDRTAKARNRVFRIKMQHDP